MKKQGFLRKNFKSLKILTYAKEKPQKDTYYMFLL